MKKINQHRLLKNNSLLSELIKLDIIRTLFSNYLSGTAEVKEKEVVETWKAEKYWKKYRHKADPLRTEAGCKTVWEQLTSQITAGNPDIDSGSYLESPGIGIRFSPVMRTYVAAAAVCLLIVTGVTYWYHTKQIIQQQDLFTAAIPDKMILATDNSAIKTIVLPDGSSVILNRGTQFGYITSQFNQEQREVWLEGEAFFDVSKNPDKPFIIHTGNMRTTVRGTSFNVKAYKEIGEINVSVRSGKVEVGTDGETFGLLTANKQLSYNEKTAKHTIAESNWEDAAAWKDHRLVLKNANIAELKLRIKQLYNINVTVEGNILDNETFGLSFQQNTEFTDVMNVLEQLYDIRYRKTNTGQFHIYRH